jgi:hypothetical protein
MKNITNKVGILLILLILIAYSIYFNFYGIDLVDSFYNYNSFKNFSFQSASGLVFLTQFAGNLVFKYFGDTLLHYRIVNSLIYVIVFLIPLVLVPKAKLNSNYFFLILLVFILYSPMIQNILNYDTFSYFALIVLICVLINYFKNSSVTKVLFLGILSAVAIGFRFPNIIVIPILMFLLLLVNYLNFRKTIWKDLLIYCSTVALSYSLIVLLFFGSYSDYTQSLTSDVSDSGYQMIDLLKSYFNGFLQIILYTTLILFAFLYYKFKENLFPNRKIDYLIGILFFIIFYYFLIFNKSFGWQLSLFLSSIFIATSLLYFIYSINQDSRNNNFQIITLIAMLLFLFVPAAGSNTGLTRCSIMIVFVPYLLVTTPFNWKKIIIFMLLLSTPFAIYDRFDKLFYDNHFGQLNVEPKTSVFKYVKTRAKLAQLINDVDQSVNTYKSKNKTVLFYGFYSHCFDYQYNINHKNTDFRQEITQKKLLDFVDKNKDKVILFVDFFENYNSNLLTLKNTFQKDKFEIIGKNNFCILAPKQ